MATHNQMSPGVHRGTQPPHLMNGNPHAVAPRQTAQEFLVQVNESVWLQLGHLAELLNETETAKNAYLTALRINQWSLPALNAIAALFRGEDKFEQAVDYLKTIIKVQPNNGETWSALGHCYLMMDELQQAYSAYQQALYHLQDPKEPKLWYGIGILYDRYGSLEHAEEAFSQVMRMEPHFDKANEIYFRLGIIYKQQTKYQQSLECFQYIVSNPPQPLTQEDIWFQIGHVYEQQKDFEAAKGAYRKVLDHDPKHAKVLQQLGWLYHQQSSNYTSQEQAIEYLEQSVNSDQTDAQSWYLLGRCYMSQTKYPKAYEAYQQAVYRDGRNPTFWCSIGVLYYQINQYRDALDAYSRAIRLNPNISEVWYDLGTLYESCNNQTNDALDAYQRAADLDPGNAHIKARLQLLRNGHATGLPNQNGAPLPQDVHPQAYQQPSVNGPPPHQWGAPAPSQAAHQQPAPPPLNTGGAWNRRLAELQTPQSATPTHQVNRYDQRDVRPPPQPRAPSPRRDQRYPEPHRPNTVPRPQSPSPRSRNEPPPQQHYPQTLPHPPAPSSHPPAQVPNRIVNPNFGNQASNTIPPPSNGPTTPPGQGPLPSYGRINSPPEIRPIIDGRPRSPNSNYQSQQQPYAHHADPSAPSGIANGAPAPASALAAAEAAAREREDPSHPPSGGKRSREWEDAGEGASQKKPANDENRAKLEDPTSRRESPPQKAEPDSAEAARRAEEVRRADENYKPSEAAHHPQPLNTITQMEEQRTQAESNVAHTLPPMKTVDASSVSNENKEKPTQLPPVQFQEPAARKVEVDENYDDSGDDEKKNSGKAGRQSASPTAAAVVVKSPVQPVSNGSSALPKVETAA